MRRARYPRRGATQKRDKNTTRLCHCGCGLLANRRCVIKIDEKHDEVQWWCTAHLPELGRRLRLVRIGLT